MDPVELPDQSPSVQSSNTETAENGELDMGSLEESLASSILMPLVMKKINESVQEMRQEG